MTARLERNEQIYGLEMHFSYLSLLRWRPFGFHGGYARNEFGIGLCVLGYWSSGNAWAV